MYKIINEFIVGPYVNLSGQDLTNKDLSSANLTNVNLTSATLTGLKTGSITGTPTLSVNYTVINNYIEQHRLNAISIHILTNRFDIIIMN